MLRTHLEFFAHRDEVGEGPRQHLEVEAPLEDFEMPPVQRVFPAAFREHCHRRLLVCGVRMHNGQINDC